MSEDEVYQKRDLLLAEMHTDIKHIVSWTEKHEVEDDNRFKEVKADIELGKKFLYGAFGIFVAVEFLTKFIK